MTECRPRAPVIGRGSTRTATARSPTPSCAATCASPTWTSATPRARTCCTTYLALRRAGPEGRLRRRDRRGQNDHHEPHQPLLRHCRRQDPLRRHQHQQDQEGGSAPLPRSLCLQDDEPLHRHGDGEHPLRPSGRDGRGVHARRQGSPARTTSSRACREGYDTHADRQRREPLAGPAPAASPLPARRSPTRR